MPCPVESEGQMVPIKALDILVTKGGKRFGYHRRGNPRVPPLSLCALQLPVWLQVTIVVVAPGCLHHDGIVWPSWLLAVSQVWSWR